MHAAVDEALGLGAAPAPTPGAAARGVTAQRWNSCPVTRAPAGCSGGGGERHGVAVAQGEPGRSSRRSAGRTSHIGRAVEGRAQVEQAAALGVHRRAGRGERRRPRARSATLADERGRRAPRGSRRAARARPCRRAGASSRSGSTTTTSSPGGGQQLDVLGVAEGERRAPRDRHHRPRRRARQRTRRSVLDAATRRSLPSGRPRASRRRVPRRARRSGSARRTHRVEVDVRGHQLGHRLDRRRRRRRRARPPSPAPGAATARPARRAGAARRAPAARPRRRPRAAPPRAARCRPG